MKKPNKGKKLRGKLGCKRLRVGKEEGHSLAQSMFSRTQLKRLIVDEPLKVAP